MLTCGLVGLPGSGKTTLFSLLTGSADREASGGQSGKRRVMAVPDNRIDTLALHFQPKKVTYAQIAVTDIPGLVPGDRNRTTHFLEEVREVDILAFVLGRFEASGPAAAGGAPSDLSALETELLLADLGMVENRIARLEEGGHVSRKDAGVHASLGRIREALENGRSFRELELSPEDREAVANMAFLTAKPAVVVLNVAEADLGSAGEETGFAAACRERGVPLVTMSAQVEREIAELSAEDPAAAAAFLRDLGLDEPGTSRLARAVYERLGLISFLTAGDDEVRAWTIRHGTAARPAAGKIHSDIERGFIRAEVIAYDDYLKCVKALGGGPGAGGPTRAAGGASGARGPAGGAVGAARGPAAGGRSGGSASLGERAMTKAKELALLRLEGKDYEIKDGDIISFRFNV